MAKVIPIESIRQSVRSAQFDGAEHDARVSFFVGSYARGEGPGSHTHPYEETFVIQEGSVTFTVDGEEIEAGPGTIVVVPPGAVHSFKGSSDERTRQVNIHPVPEMETTWLDED
jgi:quercetin dioxygenase-like cupin family protein